ncbi:MAG TPA: heat-inducible transcriptional repressor HrcA [Bryobacteraceae bacterium]|nr:heat-inducible transcriptional repressor HrcA [Bryobacteraceae bacterium]
MEPVPGQLSVRERTILHEIVGAHIESGEPVGSRTLARLRHLSLSPATIRNVMADLAEDGYLAQPHASAGRVPTEKAFRDFAASLPPKPLAHADRLRLYSRIQSAGSLEDRIATASRVLTEFTRNVGIVAALPISSQELEHIELIGLSDRRVLMIVATRDHMVRNRVVTLDRELHQNDLTLLRNYVNHHFAGWTLERARLELLRRIEEERATYDEMLRHLTLLCEKGLFADSDPQLAMDGASYLIGLDLHLTRERMHELFRALEQKQQVVALLDRFLANSQGRVGVHVGLEEAHPSMGQLALIGVTVNLPSGVRTRIAVLGPMRMQYDRVIAAVQQIGQAFESQA